jgi:hypothetical protein
MLDEARTIREESNEILRQLEELNQRGVVNK